MNGSYQLNSFTENKTSEIRRLSAQVDLFFDKEFALYQKLGLKNGMDIIDCGSGPGHLVKNIIEKLPDCKATALEIDPLLFSVLTENSKEGDKQLYKPVNRSIYETNLPANSFDFAITRLVIEHLEEPLKALYELNRILKPGGILVIISNDFAYHLLTYPVIPQLDEMYDAYCKSRFSEGGNPYIGRLLPAFLNSSNFESINFEVITAHSKILGDEAFLKSENVNISKSLVESGFLSRNTLADLVEKWFGMLKDPNHVFYRQLFVVSGEKTRNEPLHSYSESAENSFKRNGVRHTEDQPKARLDFQQAKFKSLINKFELLPRDKRTITQTVDDSATSPGPYKSKVHEITKIEDIIHTVWKHILKNELLTIDDNYFDVGGDSVLIPEIVNRLSNEYSIQIRILDIFDYPTIRQLSDYIYKNNL